MKQAAIIDPSWVTINAAEVSSAAFLFKKIKLRKNAKLFFFKKKLSNSENGS